MSLLIPRLLVLFILFKKEHQTSSQHYGLNFLTCCSQIWLEISQLLWIDEWSDFLAIHLGCFHSDLFLSCLLDSGNEADEVTRCIFLQTLQIPPLLSLPLRLHPLNSLGVTGIWGTTASIFSCRRHSYLLSHLEPGLYFPGALAFSPFPQHCERASQCTIGVRPPSETSLKLECLPLPLHWACVLLSLPK